VCSTPRASDGVSFLGSQGGGEAWVAGWGRSLLSAVACHKRCHHIPLGVGVAACFPSKLQAASAVEPQLLTQTRSPLQCRRGAWRTTNSLPNCCVRVIGWTGCGSSLRGIVGTSLSSTLSCLSPTLRPLPGSCGRSKARHYHQGTSWLRIACSCRTHVEVRVNANACRDRENVDAF